MSDELQKANDRIEELEKKLYEKDALKEDQLGDLLTENQHLKAMVESKVLKLSPGDVLVVDDAALVRSHINQFAKLAQTFRCTFVGLPSGGLDHVRQMTNEQLEPLGLQKIKVT